MMFKTIKDFYAHMIGPHPSVLAVARENESVSYIEVFLTKTAVEQYDAINLQEAQSVGDIIDQIARRDLKNAVPALLPSGNVMFAIRAGRFTVTFVVVENKIFVLEIRSSAW